MCVCVVVCLCAFVFGNIVRKDVFEGELPHRKLAMGKGGRELGSRLFHGIHMCVCVVAIVCSVLRASTPCVAVFPGAWWLW